MSEIVDQPTDRPTAAAVDGAGSEAAHAAADPSADPAEDPTQESHWIGILEWFDDVVYGLVGLAFLLAALFSLAYGLYAAGDQVAVQTFTPVGFSPQRLIDNGAGAQDIIALVSDLLLTLIIMEVLGTVVHHLRERETTLKPFLFIGIISATRGILAVGARLSVSANGSITQEEFIRDMVELGVNAIAIIALGVTMKLIGPYLNEGATPRRGAKAKQGRRPAPTAARREERNVLPRVMFLLMVLTVLVALALIGVVATAGHF